MFRKETGGFPGGWRDRFLRRGGFKYVILELLKDKPRHGYDIIRALEERFHGFYSPSPGMVYPCLQMLEEMGYVTSVEEDGKKTYSITEDGRKFLFEHERTAAEIKEQMSTWWHGEGGNEFRETARELHGLGRMLVQELRQASPEKLRQIREVVVRTRKELEAILKS